MKKYLIILFLVSFSVLGAQQMPIISQYMINGFTYNPAMAGVEGYKVFNISAREQWLGLENPPRTYQASFHSKLKGKKMGLGVGLYHDQDGLIGQTGGQFSYAYHIKLGKGIVSGGLSASFYQLRINTSKMISGSADDTYLNSINNQSIVPDFSAGIFYTSGKFFIGASAAQLLEAKIKLTGTENEGFVLQRHFYLYTGGNIRMGRNSLTPSILARAMQNGTYTADANLRFNVDNKFWLGASYRTSNSVIGMFGIHIEQFSIGYAFDYSLNALAQSNYGSHELMLTYILGGSAASYNSRGSKIF